MVQTLRRVAAKARAVRSEDLFYCPVHRSRISVGACKAFCSVPQNNTERCTREFHCESPWRLCWACLLNHGLGERGGVAENKDRGLCDFHLKNGIEKRPDWAPKRDGESGHGSSIDDISDRIRSHSHTAGGGGSGTVKTQKTIHLVKGKQVPVDTVLEVDCALVVPLSEQPRTYFDKDELEGLLNSIAEAGQIQTVPAVSLPDGTFRIRDGERRWRVCTKLKRPLRVVVVPELPHEEEIEQAAIANFLRQGHTPIEQARIFMRLKEGPLKRTVAKIGQMFGMTTASVYNHLILIEKLDVRVQNLMDPVKQGSSKAILRPSVAQYLTAFHERPEEQVGLAREIMKRKLNLREAKTLIDKYADKLKIKTGRGREAQPYDHIRTIKRTMANTSIVLDRFSEFSDDDWERLWKTHSWTERELVANRLTTLIKRLQELQGHVDRTLKG
ncbi:MAG: ParB/RepB/Spo0J family partition protein [Candidatus Campbellbacteria bacterium]|nr:ParB/RepB/Spo0J family partition protein [Candidatus Campbellbacteria bacterium]